MPNLLMPVGPCEPLSTTSAFVMSRGEQLEYHGNHAPIDRVRVCSACIQRWLVVSHNGSLEVGVQTGRECLGCENPHNLANPRITRVNFYERWIIVSPPSKHAFYLRKKSWKANPDLCCAVLCTNGSGMGQHRPPHREFVTYTHLKPPAAGAGAAAGAPPKEKPPAAGAGAGAGVPNRLMSNAYSPAVWGGGSNMCQAKKWAYVGCGKRLPSVCRTFH